MTLSEQAREIVAQWRNAPELIEWQPTIDAAACLVEMFELIEQSLPIEDRRNALLAEYNAIQRQSSGTRIREKLTYHSRSRLKLIGVVACEEQLSAMQRRIAEKATPLILEAQNLARGPLATVLSIAAPIIGPCLSKEQLDQLKIACPGIDWDMHARGQHLTYIGHERMK